MYSLRMSVWIVPPSCSGGTPCSLGRDDVEGEQDRRRRVDRHRDGDLAERDALEERLHVVERVDGDALAADLAERAGVVGVVAHQRRHVERGREPGLAVVEQVAEALVGLLGRAEAGELAHRPEPAAVHRRVGAAGEGILARVAEVALVVDVGVFGAVERLDRLAGDRGVVYVVRRAVGVRPILRRGLGSWFHRVTLTIGLTGHQRVCGSRLLSRGSSEDRQSRISRIRSGGRQSTALARHSAIGRWIEIGVFGHQLDQLNVGVVGVAQPEIAVRSAPWCAADRAARCRLCRAARRSSRR